MKNIITLLLFVHFVSTAQNSERFVAKGLFSGKGTLAFGKPTAYSGTNMYVSGNLEYYLQNNVSFRGGLWFFLGSSKMEHPFLHNHSLFTGYFYHFNTKNHLDPYIGLEPGICWTQLKTPDATSNDSYPYNTSAYPRSINPVASMTVGINYYATNFTHLFIEAKYMTGTHISDIPAVSLNEFRIAFGFGFNMWAIKKKSS